MSSRHINWWVYKSNLWLRRQGGWKLKMKNYKWKVRSSPNHYLWRDPVESLKVWKWKASFSRGVRKDAELFVQYYFLHSLKNLFPNLRLCVLCEMSVAFLFRIILKGMGVLDLCLRVGALIMEEAMVCWKLKMKNYKWKVRSGPTKRLKVGKFGGWGFKLILWAFGMGEDT